MPQRPSCQPRSCDWRSCCQRGASDKAKLVCRGRRSTCRGICGATLKTASPRDTLSSSPVIQEICQICSLSFDDLAEYVGNKIMNEKESFYRAVRHILSCSWPIPFSQLLSDELVGIASDALVTALLKDWRQVHSLQRREAEYGVLHPQYTLAIELLPRGSPWLQALEQRWRWSRKAGGRCCCCTCVSMADCSSRLDRYSCPRARR